MLTRGNNTASHLFDQDAGIESRLYALEDMCAALKQGIEDVATMLVEAGIVTPACKVEPDDG